MATAAPTEAIFASLLVGAPILDPRGERVAAVQDLIARLDLDARERYPPLTGMVVQVAGRDVFLPWSHVEGLDQDRVRLAQSALDLLRFERREGEVLLARDVLDKQLVDLNGRRIIRASDIVLGRIGRDVRVVGVDVGFAAIWRRAAPRALGRAVRSAALVDWTDVEYLARESSAVHLRGGHPKIAQLHPVEIAQLIEQLPNRLGSEIIESLADSVAADVIEELSDERHEIVGHLDHERAADLLEEMGPDAAADVLADLSEEAAANILAQMEAEEAADVREVLAHPEDTAGRLMTTEFATASAEMTAGAAIEHLRGLADRPPFLHYVYVLDERERLVGTLSLPDLVLARPETPVAALMRSEPGRATPDDSPDEVAREIAEYNLLALPVVDDEGRMLGIVTVDDVMEELVPEQSERRLPRIFG
ncbi:MAG TPA: CBS domain-containing protein [Chloroflexota bacterium]